MKLVNTGLASGKTHRAVHALKDNPKALMLVFGNEERLRIQRDYKLAQTVASRILTFDEFMSMRAKGRPTNEVIIDNAEKWLSYIVYSNSSWDRDMKVWATGHFLLERPSDAENPYLSKEYLAEFTDTTRQAGEEK